MFMQKLFFEDFESGQKLPSVDVVVSGDDVARFAAEFDPEAPQRSNGPRQDRDGEGGAASDWYVAALGMRMICEAFVGRTAALGAPGVEEVEWPHAVRPGDELRLESRVSTLRPSRSRPEMGLVGFEFTLSNQHDECVMKQSNVLLVQRRAKEAVP